MTIQVTALKQKRFYLTEKQIINICKLSRKIGISESEIIRQAIQSLTDIHLNK